MRQIDNMTPQEIDTLALKGMTRRAQAPSTQPTRDAELDAIRLQRLDRIIELKAHADKLAEALRDLRTRIVATGPNCLNTTKADEALAAYEAAQ